ncbi:MAG: S8 family peptidase [Caldilineaceae bacterium]|nr:S8 family peptidase [Caldilineaceae bacterium]
MNIQPLVTQATPCPQRLATLVSTLLLTLLLLLSFQMTVQGAPSLGALDDDDDDIEIEGRVTQAPAHPAGYGLWLVLTPDQVTYRVIVDEETEWEEGIAVVGQWVSVEGELTAPLEILAEEIKREEDEIEGFLLSVPATLDGVGDWVIQSDSTQTYTIRVVSSTLLEDGVLSPGVWVEADGWWQPDGTFLATELWLDDFETNQVVVRLATGVLSTTIASQYGLTPLQTLLASGNIHLFQTADDQEETIVAELSANATQVIWAELNYVGGIPEGDGYKTWHWGGDDPTGYINQNAFAQINLTGTTTATTTFQGQGITIAVLDTGVDLDHPVLAARLLPGWDIISDDALPDDEGFGLGWGHGTHVTGILAQVAPQSQILPVRVLDSNGRGNTFTLAYAIEWAVKQGADVINLSLGTPFDSFILRDTIQQATAQGVIVVAAAGNMNTDQPQFPASYPAVIAVTAVDGNNQKAAFANYGAGWVDLAAPGVGIISTMVGPLGSGYATWSGTSMSAPFVSGTAARIRQALPAATAPLVERYLRSHTQSLDSVNPAYAGQLGGLLNVSAVLTDAPVDSQTPFESANQLYLPLIRQ